MHPSRYRVRLVLDLFRALVIPSLVLAFVLHFTDLHSGFLSHVIFLILWSTIRNIYRKSVQSQEAKQLGARLIPCVVGAWPGNLDILIRMLAAFKSSYVLDVYLDLFEEYKCTTLNTRILWVDQIITMDQEHSKFVLATGFNHFWRGRAQKERMETFLGEGIFNRDDEAWKMHRATARPFFARERISDFEIIERHTAHTLAILSSLSASELPCDAQDLYARFTLDAASEFLFGENLKTLSATLPVAGKTNMGPKGSVTHDTWGSFAHAFEMAQQIVTTRARLGYFWPFFELFGDKAIPHSRAIRRWLDPLVKQAVQDKAVSEKTGIKSTVKDKTFLQHLADSTDDTSLIRDQLLNILLASRDTTACLLTYTTYFMAIYPDITQKLRAEVLTHCGHGAPTYDSIKKLKYMKAVLNETLRLFPPVPLNVRETRAVPCTLPPSDPSNPHHSYPLYMPGSTTIMYFPLLTQRNPALWGPDADEFDPDRWLDPDRVAKFVSNPTMYTPFSAGPRICVGQNYAYNQASYFFARLLQQFDTFTLTPEYQPEGSLPPPEWKSRKGRQAAERVYPAAAMTLFVKGGMWARFGKVQS